ncbi:hypothetical protein Hamer_G014481 [Homarus americanus]|uniref:Uncharacterized protein n=1 Tax=Homarus americanus TaxID=6706 RepID=A0A8J5JTG2_HOMAM|nr:hypothetical protein Hamer_G014481 [Homarus americanus]
MIIIIWRKRKRQSGGQSRVDQTSRGGGQKGRTGKDNGTWRIKGQGKDKGKEGEHRTGRTGTGRTKGQRSRTGRAKGKGREETDRTGVDRSVFDNDIGQDDDRCVFDSDDDRCVFDSDRCDDDRCDDVAEDEDRCDEDRCDKAGQVYLARAIDDGGGRRGQKYCVREPCVKT